MSVHTAFRPATATRGDRAAPLLRAGLLGFGLTELALALFMTVAPHAFYRAIGPFDAYNGHYIRDVASFEGALGIALLLSLRRPSWQVPVLAVTAMQFALHSLNHLFDIGDSHPAWTGYFDFISLAAATLMLIWLLRIAPAGRRDDAEVPQPPKGGPR